MASGTTRLHISPFTPALLESVLKPSVRSAAEDISFHTLETFPEQSYGYVNLPTMEAEKLKKKLNGSILKGKKMKVEEAKPKKRHRVEEDANSASPDDKPEVPEPEKISKKRKGEKDVLPGHELSPDRHVKRGWTEPAKKDKDRDSRKSKTKEKKPNSQRSKYTDNPECIFRTNPPANHSADEKADKKKSKTKTKTKDGVVVHEFSKTVKHPTFLRSGENSEAATLTDEFVEGKGWVSRGGDIKESVKSDATKPSKGDPGRVKGGKDKVSKIAKRAPTKESSSQESSSDSESSSSSSSEADTDSSESDDDDSETTSDTSSSEDSSSGSSDEDKESVGETKPGELDEAKATPTLPNQDSPPLGTPLTKTSEQPKNGVHTTSDSMHPLDTLFKVPAIVAPKPATRPSLEVDTQFSFFGGDVDEDSVDDDAGGTANTGPEPPQTPFTKQDLQNRGIRSAAPTPDTAAPQRISFWENNDNNNYDCDEEYDEHYQENETSKPKKLKRDTDANGAGVQGKGKGEVAGAEAGDFASWFWENRGENNRAWKKRRREAAKEKRQRENRRKGNKGK